MKSFIQGSEVVFPIDLATKRTSGVLDPFDLTGHVAATSKVCWQAGTTKIEKFFTSADIVVTDVPKGKIDAKLLSTETDDFAALDIGDIEIHIDLGGGNVQIFQILEAFNVLGSKCPAP